MQKYNPGEDWELTDSINKGSIKVFRFRTKETKKYNGYDLRIVVDKEAKTEEEAWSKLHSPNWHPL